MADSSLLDLFEKPGARELRPFEEAWGWALMILLPFALYFVYRDLGLYFQYAPLGRLSFRPDTLAWGVFGAVQAVSRLPLAVRRSTQGAATVLHLGGLALCLAATACIALSIAPGPAALWWIGFAISLAWLGFETYLAAFVPKTSGVGIGRRLYCAFAGGLVPNAPFPFAMYLLAVQS